MRELVAAAVQMRSGVTPDANISAMESLVREAAGRGARYVQTPEMTGAVQKSRAGLRSILRTEADDAVLKAASALAAELGIFLHIGSTAIDVGNDMTANRGVVFGPDGAKLAHYDKIHMFDVDLDNGESWRESAVYQPGDCRADRGPRRCARSAWEFATISGSRTCTGTLHSPGPIS
jgi:predicted amidohydrolase